MLFEWLEGSVEYRNCGLNISTFSFFATFLFTLLQCYALVGQDRSIRKEGSGESVSVVLFSYMTVVYLTFGYYGATHGSIGSVLNGLVGFFYIRVLLGLWKFKRFSKKELCLMAVFLLAGLTEVFLPWKDLIMTLLMGAATIPLVQQVLVIRRNKNVGVLSIKFFVVFAASLTFWTIYAFATGNVPLQIVNPPMFLVVGSLFYYWFKYR